MIKNAQFNIGDIVVHKRQGYTAVVVDVDSVFQASGNYNPRALEKFKHRLPWYRLLVDESNQMTYVEESSLALSISHAVIDNPKVSQFLSKGKEQGYQGNQLFN